MEVLVLVFWGFVITQVAAIPTTTYLHRSSSHKSVTFHPVVEFFLQTILWLTTGINRKEWVAVHLCHHAHADVEGDPHSPIVSGFWKVQLGNVFLYRKAAKQSAVLRYGKHIEPTWAERTIYKSPELGLLVGISLACSIWGIVPGLIVSAAHTFFYLFVINNLVNGYCHWNGYKNFPAILAFNSHLVAWITMGEGFHNNHHAMPASSKLSYTAAEVDHGWTFINIMRHLKLATLNRPLNR